MQGIINRWRVAAALLGAAGAVAALLIALEHPQSDQKAAAVAPILDGTYKIGVDITAGRWHTDGPKGVHAYGIVDAVPRCQWRIVHGEDVSHVHVVSTVTQGQSTSAADIDVAPDGATFETLGCKAWQRR